MQAETSMPDTVVIGPDESHPLQVRASIHSGLRRLDLRSGRQTDGGFTPTGTGMMLDAVDLPALQAGIVELLDVSQGAQSVARVVREDVDGRRLRAEIEPFGARYLAKLGFWQRVRDTWRPADDGVVLAATRLPQLASVLQTLGVWMLAAPQDRRLGTDVLERRTLLRRWPAPGADWISQEGTRLVFHPRGVRATFTPERNTRALFMAVQPWERQDSLWTPNPVALSLTCMDTEILLQDLSGLLDGAEGGEHVQLVSEGEAEPAILTLHQPSDPERFMSLPATYLPGLGRALAWSWSRLYASLSRAQRESLRERISTMLQPPPNDEQLDQTDEPEVPQAGGHKVVSNVEEQLAHTEDAPLHEAILVPEEPVEAVNAPAAPVAETVDVEPVRERVSSLIATVPLGSYQVALSLDGYQDDPYVQFAWDAHELRLSTGVLQTLLTDLRSLYYEALLGRRGRSLMLGDNEPVIVTIDNQGPQLYCVFQQCLNGAETTLRFPASQVPALLDAAQAEWPT